MKKRMLSLLLVLAMLAAMIVMPASATEAEKTQTVPAGYCQHCETVIPADEWIPWDISNTGPRTGHYYLDRDINDQVAQITINLDEESSAGHPVCLHHSALIYKNRPSVNTPELAVLTDGRYFFVTRRNPWRLGCFCGRRWATDPETA